MERIRDSRHKLQQGKFQLVWEGEGRGGGFAVFTLGVVKQ